MNLPPYPRFPELASGVVALRRVSPADADSLLEITFYDARPARDLAEAAEMEEKIGADYRAGSGIQWVIVRTATAEVVGTLSFHRGFAGGVGELGCVLKPAFRGQGLMREAMKLAIEFGLHTMHLAQITAITTQPNGAAIRLLEELGFRKTADLPDDALAYCLT